MLGRINDPMRFILLLLERIQNIPNEVEVNRTRKPIQLVNMRLTAKRIRIIKKLSFV